MCLNFPHELPSLDAKPCTGFQTVDNDNDIGDDYREKSTMNNYVWGSCAKHEWRILSVRGYPPSRRFVQLLTKTSQHKTLFLSYCLFVILSFCRFVILSFCLFVLFVIFVQILKWYSLTAWLTKGRCSVPGQLKNWIGDGVRCQRCYPITTLFHH